MRVAILSSMVIWSGLFVVLFLFTGCSFGVQIGYHGQTGLDNRTQTQLVRDGDIEQVKGKQGRY